MVDEGVACRRPWMVRQVLAEAGLFGRRRAPGEPEIFHDQASQFRAREWRIFVQRAGITDVATRSHHPWSNGRQELFHRTLR